MENPRWWELRWPLRHAMAAPFGVFAVTALLTWWISGQWPGPDNGELAAELVDLAAVVYGMMALTLEGGVRLMFWAWEKHKAWREAMREEGRVEGRKEGRVTGRVEGRVEGRRENQKATAAHLERVSRETGIPLERLLPPREEE